MKSKNNLFFRKPFKYSCVNITLYIVIINCIVFAVNYFIPYNRLVNYGALNVFMVEVKHTYWQFFTYMFIHTGGFHLFFNMLSLCMVGFVIERTIGSKEFLLYYLLCGVLSGVFSFFVYKFTGQYFIFLLGASGAIYSLLFAYSVLFPRRIIYIWGIIPLPAVVLVLAFALIEILALIKGGDGISHLTHMFGFLAGWLYFIVRMGINPIKVWKNNCLK